MGPVAGEKSGVHDREGSPTIINPLLLDLEDSIEHEIFGQVRSLADSRLQDTSILVNTVQTQIKRALPLHLEPSPY